MNSTLSAILDTVVRAFSSLSKTLGLDLLFFIAMAVEVLFVVFFLIKSAFSYEARLNRCLDKLNYWLFERKVVSEENIQELNTYFKTKVPKRVCYYWQQYILFREGAPSTYLSADNLVEKPLKTSSYNSNIKNLGIFSTVWAFVVALFVLILASFTQHPTGEDIAIVLFSPIVILLLSLIFTVYLRARKNAVLNTLYQNVSLFGRFMDNACIDLPSYIDYQMLFTPQEIEQGQPVLREFLDYKARKEKEEFNRAREDDVHHEEYDFSATGVDGSIVLDRAMKESELFLKKKEKILVKISQLESEIDSRRKNFDNIQKDYQTKIQASKENIARLRQMQEETTNRIESNYYRKQQTQEIAKQEQFEQEFEQQRAKYQLERTEGDEEIKKLNKELESYKTNVENALLSEYQTFYNKFCKSAEKVVGKVFEDRIATLKEENERNKQYITELEIRLKSIPQGEYDASAGVEGHYDENGNYVYANGTFYDKDGNFHDENGNVYSQDGVLLTAKEETPAVETKQIVDFDDFDALDFMTDTQVKGDVYDVAENVINNLDGDHFEIVNNSEKNNFMEDRDVVKESKENKPETKSEELVPFVLETEEIVAPVKETKQAEVKEETKPEVAQQEEKPKKKPGRPRKQKVEEEQVKAPAKKRGRPRKLVEVKPQEKPEEKPQTTTKKVGRPKKLEQKTKTPVATVTEAPKRKAGRPKKLETTTPATVETVTQPKRGRGRPRKNIDTILEINKRLSQEEAKLNEMRQNLNKELENAMNEIDSANVDDKQLRRDQLITQIENLQEEAQDVMKKNDSEAKLAEINAKLEALLEEVKKLN